MDVVSIGETMILFTPHTDGQMRYAQNFSTRIAGAETNTLIGLAKLGHQTGWISRVGKDEFGSSLLSTVRGEGVDTSQVILDNQAPTGILFKEIQNESTIRIYYYRKYSAASTMNPKDIKDDYLLSAKYLYVTGITLALSPSCRDTVFYAIQLAKKNGLRVIFDPNLRLKLWGEAEARKTLLEISAMSDVVLPGVSEGEFLLGTSNCEKIAEEFHQLGVDTVIVKRGERGAYYSNQQEKGYVEGFKVNKVVDPVGAGDGFAAGVLSGMLEHMSLKDCVKRGCAIGAMVTTTRGDIEGLPDRDLLNSFMQSSKNDDVLR
ncbi:sugar kinase [Bacillus sp. MRMR6]|uniref:sugar kinase n=1 Tax=Bacillus sp. MRMR6 TaxID=1928617 RepID=UPI00095166E2|nr:sugar kinase [Bacillus sp. MRMR6]OLS40773.1 2-dehydro-3-deoxygluconokinase [Bacillus sp. MRMR6]